MACTKEIWSCRLVFDLTRSVPGQRKTLQEPVKCDKSVPDMWVFKP
jgi:hypothetical protein